MRAIEESPLTERVSGGTPKASRKLSDPERHEIKAKYLAGATTYDLSSEYDVHRETVSRALKTQDVPPRAKVRRLTDDQVQEAGKQYFNGATLAELALRYDVGQETIRRELHNIGVTLRPRGGRQ